MQAEVTQENRKVKRVDVTIRSTLRHSGTAVDHVEISNLSFYGFRADGAPPLARGEYVSIELPNVGSVRARIAWSKDGRFGAVFPTAVNVRKCMSGAAKSA